MGFRSVRKSVTLNGVMAIIIYRYFFSGHTVVAYLPQNAVSLRKRP